MPTDSFNHNNSTHLQQHTVCNNLIILDWDDTLFPTSMVQQISKRNLVNTINSATLSTMPPQFQQNKRSSYNIKTKRNFVSKLSVQEYQYLTSLSFKIYQLLSQYILHYGSSNIVIVTASTKGWIEQSLIKVLDIGYFMMIYQLLFQQINKINKIEMIHPLQTKSESPSFDALKWKQTMFKQLLLERYLIHDVINTFIIIGDSNYEIEAGEKCKNLFMRYGENVFIDSIQLLIKPTLLQQISEMDLLISFCGKFELNSKMAKKDITINYGQEMAKLKAKYTKKKSKS